MSAPASVVVPVLNDAPALAELIADLRQDASLEIVVVDGGSSDDSVQVASRADAVCVGASGRGRQMRRGVCKARHDWLWLLHADSRISPAALAAFSRLRTTPGWGWFDVRLDGDGWALRVVEAAMNRRAALTAIATGDQGIFVHRDLLSSVGGVPPQALMEDVELSKRLRRLARPRRVRAPLATSARRWRRDGTLRTVLDMWQIRVRYFCGEAPERLAHRYYGSAPDGDPAKPVSGP